jgi:hypothetical protein
MPFTFSHPAIVLPIARVVRIRFISVSALIIGSMAPDFEYFIKMKLSGRFSHTLPGAFLFCLPVAFVTLLVFHKIVKQPFISSLPTYFNSRLTALRVFDLLPSIKQHPLTYLGCLLLGIFSHLLWDSFTHANHFMVRHVAFLSSPVSITGFPNMPLFRYIQHGSTVLGAVYIVYFFHSLPKAAVSNSMNWRYWLFVMLIALIAFAIRASFEFEYLGDIAATAISSLFLSMILVSLYFNIRSSHGKPT